MTRDIIKDPLNTYDRVPNLYWYRGSVADHDSYRTIHKHGRIYLGYKLEPDPSVLFKFNLVFLAYAPSGWFWEYLDRKNT